MRIGALTILVCLSNFPLTLFAGDPLADAEQLRSRGDYTQAEAVLREALKAEPGDADLLNSLGDLLREEDRDQEARTYFQNVFDQTGVSWKLHFGALMGLADLDREQESWEQSISKWNEAIAIAESHNNSLFESFAVRGLGETFLYQGHQDRAEPLLRRAVALLEQNHDAPPYRMSVALDSLASLYRTENKTSMAEELWTRELQINRNTFGDYHPQTGLVMGHLAEAWSLDGEIERAREYSRQAASIMASHFGDHSVAMASALVNEAVVEQRAHQLRAAADLYARAFGILQVTKPSGSVSEVVAHLYAGVLDQLHRGKEARRIVAEATSFRAK